MSFLYRNKPVNKTSEDYAFSKIFIFGIQLQTKVLMNWLTFELGELNPFLTFTFWDGPSLEASIRLGA